jgi:MoxR-like ATPase
LADEINRASPRVQAALLEAMEERQVTIDGRTHLLNKVFMVIGTMNAYQKDEGTNPLPSAQFDRFLFKLQVEQPSYEDERRILNLSRIEWIQPSGGQPQRLSLSDLQVARADIQRVQVSEEVSDYMVRLKFATHDPSVYAPGSYSTNNNPISKGVSPRATIGLDQAAKAYAWLQNRSSVTIADVIEIAKDVLRGRIKLKPEAIAKGTKVDDVIETLLSKVPEKL